MAQNPTLAKALVHDVYKTIDLVDIMNEVLDPDPGLDEPEYLAGMALELATLHTEVTAALEVLKAKLRDAARDDLLDDLAGVVTINGEDYESEPLGTVTVTFPPKIIKLRKETDTELLKRSLGPAFRDYFDEVPASYVPTKDFEDKTLQASGQSPAKAAEARLALSAVEVTAQPTPRVSFAYAPKPE